MRDKVLISFDVTSLITNIPEAIKINLNFENSPDIKLTKCELRKLFKIRTSEHILPLLAAFLIRLMV